MLKENLYAMIRQGFDIPDAQEIKPEDKLVDDLGADSLDITHLVMCAEEMFEISIPDEVSVTITTVDDFEKAISALLPNSGDAHA